LVLAALGCLVITLLLKTGAIDASLRSTNTKSLDFGETFAAAVSLFLAFGYENFSASGWFPNAFLVLVPVFGLAWSALVLAVIVRRAYR
jgi:hypothetical protein